MMKLYCWYLRWATRRTGRARKRTALCYSPVGGSRTPHRSTYRQQSGQCEQRHTISHAEQRWISLYASGDWPI